MFNNTIDVWKRLFYTGKKKSKKNLSHKDIAFVIKLVANFYALTVNVFDFFIFL